MCFRNGAPSKVVRRNHPLGNYVRIGLLLSILAGFVLAGCSGGHSGGGSAPAPTPTPSPTPIPAVSVTASIAWPARSRAATPINGTASALSAIITLIDASTTGSNLTATANRPSGSDTSPVTTTYPLVGGVAIPGKYYTIQVNFYSQTNGQGTIVASASQAFTYLQTDGTLKATTFTTGTNVASVKITDIATAGSNPPAGLNKTLLVGQTADVEYTLYDSLGNVLAAPVGSYGSGFVTVTDSTKIKASGDQIIGVAPTAGTTFSISVDGVTSALFTVEVTSPETVSISPSGTTTSPEFVSPGIPQTFTASISPASGDTTPGVTWSLAAGAVGTLSGATSTTVVYTPPAAISSAGSTDTLIATSKYDPNVTATVVIDIKSLVSIAISPTAASLSFKQTQKFTATVTDDPLNQGVTWSVTGGTVSSTLTSAGTPVTYTAPATTGTYTLTATSVYDTTKSASVTISVASTVGISITTPATTPVTTFVKNTTSFVATVQNDPVNAGVTWTATGGTFSATTTASGASTLYTAPAIAGTYTVTATSVLDPTKSTSFTVIVQDVTFAVTPGSASLSINISQSTTSTKQFTVGTITGDTQNSGVTWSIQEGATGGTITATGLYTAPSSIASTPSGTVTFHVVATSKFDTAKSVVVPVTVGAASVTGTIN